MTYAFLVDSVPFTADVIAGKTSLGGSESACLGLARALQARGHFVHVFTTQLDAGCANLVDHAGVTWHALDDFGPMNEWLEWDVVVALRMFSIFAYRPVFARLKILWNQDLLVPGNMQMGVMGVGWAIDHLAYVSTYHRQQWEQLQPELAPLGWVTRNGYDPADLPQMSVKDPGRIVHISRPERGLGPLLTMWPALRQRHPHVTLRLCRYNSMYDAGGWGEVCKQWDARVREINDQVGGITYLGELNKPELYREISHAAVMWYPGVSSFAETSCIAAIEAQACGTPFVGSYRGALPETVPSGILVRGHHDDDAYQRESLDAVSLLLEGCKTSSVDYRQRQRDGLAHVESYAYATIAAEWEAQIDAWFIARYQAGKVGVMRQLLHEDDHTAAKLVATEIGDQTSADFCDYVIAGKDQTSEHYGNAAIQDPLDEIGCARFKAVAPAFEGCTRLLDVACGNGSFAIAMALAHPELQVYGLDYAEANIVRAREAAEKMGLSDRLTFERCTVYDFDKQELDADFLSRTLPVCDGAFIGEFVEHVGNCQALIDGVDAVLQDGAKVVYTCPHGAYAELVPRGMPLRRGHVHRFHADDLAAVWGPKRDFTYGYLPSGYTPRGTPLGNWIIQYRTAPNRPAGIRPLWTRIERTRPMPTLSVVLIAKNAEQDLGRGLASVYHIADEILVGDTGSTDATIAIAKQYGARVFDLPAIEEHAHGFSGARNELLNKAKGEWVLWIDADEMLMQAPFLRRYLDGLVYNGYVIHQTHLYIDAPPTWDIPVRLFRHTGKVQFYGCIHEQPQDGEPNADIYPTLDAGDLRIAHFGYLTEDIREEKRVTRNLPLLLRDATTFPDRLLGKVLLIREAVIQADHLSAQSGGVTPRAHEGYTQAIQLFMRYFDDPAHKYHKLARPWYEAALRHLGVGWEQEIALAGKKGGLNGSRAGAERVWVRDGDEYTRVMAFMVNGLAEKMKPTTFLTDPDAFLPPVPNEAPTGPVLAYSEVHA